MDTFFKSVWNRKGYCYKHVSIIQNTFSYVMLFTELSMGVKHLLFVIVTDYCLQNAKVTEVQEEEILKKNMVLPQQLTFELFSLAVWHQQVDRCTNARNLKPATGRTKSSNHVSKALNVVEVQWNWSQTVPYNTGRFIFLPT